MKKTNLLTAFFAVMLFIAGCEKEKTPEQRGVFVSTASVTNFILVTPANTVSVTAGGDADLVGAESINERGVVWGAAANPTTTDNKATAGTGTGNFSATITGLAFGSTVHVRAFVISNGKTYYGKDVEFVASVPVELIKNGDLSLPASPFPSTVNETTNWKTDETNTGLIGRGADFWRGSPSFWMSDYAKSFYQEVGTVPALRSDYTIKFDANWYWTDWNDYDPTISVTFSVYTGSDPTTRVEIGKTDFTNGFFPGWGDNWKAKTGAFSIPAGSAHAGKKLIIEFDVIPYNGPWDPNLWFDFDNISVIRTLR